MSEFPIGGVIFIAALVFWPVTFLLIHMGRVIVEGIPPAGYLMILLVWLTFTKAGWFFAQPPRIVIPGIMAWGGSILALLFWIGS